MTFSGNGMVIDEFLALLVVNYSLLNHSPVSKFNWPPDQLSLTVMPFVGL